MSCHLQGKKGALTYVAAWFSFDLLVEQNWLWRSGLRNSKYSHGPKRRNQMISLLLIGHWTKLLERFVVFAFYYRLANLFHDPDFLEEKKKVKLSHFNISMKIEYEKASWGFSASIDSIAMYCSKYIMMKSWYSGFSAWFGWFSCTEYVLGWAMFGVKTCAF
jgi:hypothetical protein